MAKKQSAGFERLLGKWRTIGNLYCDGIATTIEGEDSYELILNNQFILHKANVKIGEEQSETLEMISRQDESGNQAMQYFNSKGEKGSMAGNLNGSTMIITGKEMKFNGLINEDESEISGEWFTKTSSGEWIRFIELKLQKKF